MTMMMYIPLAVLHDKHEEGDFRLLSIKFCPYFSIFFRRLVHNKGWQERLETNHFFCRALLRRNPREDPPLSFLMETHQISAFDFDKKDEIKPPQPQIWILTKFNTFAIFSFAFNVVSLMKGSTFTQTWIEHFCFVPVAPSLAHNWILNSLKSAKGCFFPRIQQPCVAVNN